VVHRVAVVVGAVATGGVRDVEIATTTSHAAIYRSFETRRSVWSCAALRRPAGCQKKNRPTPTPSDSAARGTVLQTTSSLAASPHDHTTPSSLPFIVVT